MKKTILSFASLCFGTMILMGSGCPLIPGIETKIVELAVGSSMTLQFEARGSINNDSETVEFQLDEEIDIAQILDDAGVNVSDVHDIALAGVAYRVTKADPVAGRRIVDSTVSVARGSGASAVLVANFSDEADVTYDFRTVDLDPAGVAVINGMLDDLLIAVQNGQNSGLSGSATWSGTSTPVSEDTNFDWEIRLDITIVGEVELDLPK